MSKNNHPIEQEELMAYLDGELATERAVTAAAHLERCTECQQLAAEMKDVSQKLMAWEVEVADSKIAPDIAAALEEREKQPPKATRVSKRRDWGMFFSERRLVWAAGIAVAGSVVLAVSVPTLLRSRHAGQESVTSTFTYDASGRLSTPPPPTPPTPLAQYDSNGNVIVAGNNGAASERGSTTSYYYDSSTAFTTATNSLHPLSPPPSPQPKVIASGNLPADEDQDGNASEESDLATSNGPLIVRTAGVTITTRDKEFDKSRAALEEILKRHHGYIGSLSVSAPSDAGRTLTAALRVPSAQLDATLAELKALGRVEGESQGGEEVTQQYVDLQARLANAKHTEKRLKDILSQRTGKLSDVLAVELQIGRVRGEIERMQAEKKEMGKQVTFATLNATLKEDYKAPMEMAPPSTSSRFHNAAVDGYRSVVEGLMSVLLFLLSAGPSLLVWAAILFFPARFAWKRLRRKLAAAQS
jgi:hypothetical protein